MSQRLYHGTEAKLKYETGYSIRQEATAQDRATSMIQRL